jgi:hypothetical protein
MKKENFRRYRSRNGCTLKLVAAENEFVGEVGILDQISSLFGKA